MQTSKPIDGRDLVWAILSEYGCLHITGITEKVLECGLSTLGLKAEKPRQSVSNCLTTNHRFKSQRWGFYGISDPELKEKDERVGNALKLYKEFRNSRDLAITARKIESMAELKEKVKTLEAKLEKISAILKQ